MSRKNHHPDGATLQAWLEGDLTPGGPGDDVSLHVGTCAKCDGERQSFELLFEELEHVEKTVTADPRTGFSRRVMADILRREAAGRVRRNRVMIPAAAAAVFAMLLAWWLAPATSPSGPVDSAGGLAMLGALLKIIHSGAVMLSEGFELTVRLARTSSTLLAALPSSVWAACLTLFCMVHGALFLCLQQYARHTSAPCGAGPLGRGSSNQ